MLSAAGLQDHEKLVVSFEGIVYEVAKYGSKQLPYAVNNHIESDTRMFLLLSTLHYQKKVWVVRSTNTDVLFAAVLNYQHLPLEEKTLLIH